jgi:hypothetical protein
MDTFPNLRRYLTIPSSIELDTLLEGRNGKERREKAIDEQKYEMNETFIIHRHFYTKKEMRSLVAYTAFAF